MSARKSPKKEIQSLNSINPSPQNVDRLFHEACQKIKEAFVLKKMGFELPEHLSGGSLPVVALAFERDILILIAKKMGVTLTFR